MFCKKCGGEIDKGIVFCPHCGANLKEDAKVPSEQNAAPEFVAAPENAASAEKKEAPKSVKLPVNKKIIQLAGIAVAAVVVVILLASLLFKGGSDWDYASENAIDLIKVDGEYNILNFKSGKLVKGPDITGYNSVTNSMDGAVVALIDSENELYIINQKGFTKVAEDVREVEISATGKGLVYAIRDSDEYEIFLYDIGKKKSTSVAKELNSFESLVISPDGKSIAYTDEDGKCHVVANGKEQEDRIKDAYAIGISDDADYLYYTKSSNFWMKKKKADDAEKLGSSLRVAYFNKDLSQVLYVCSTDDGYRTYFAEKGKKADEVVAKGYLQLLFPDNAQEKEYNNCIIVGRDDLNETIVYMNSGLYYITDKYKAEKIVGEFDDYEISEDGIALVYRKGEKLYRVSNVKKSLEPKQIGEDLEARRMYSDGDLGSIYYINNDNEIFYISGSKKPKKVYDDTFSDVLQHGDDLYFISDEELYVSQGGDKRVKVSGIEDASDLDEINGSVYCETEDAVFLIKGKKSQKVYED